MIDIKRDERAKEKQKIYKKGVSEEKYKRSDKKAMIFFLWAQRHAPVLGEPAFSVCPSVYLGGAKDRVRAQ